MSGLRRPVVCDRVRAQISVDLDGELSQLERAMLAAHLERCAACRAYGADVAAFTIALREASPERMEVPVVVRRRPGTVIASRIPAGIAAAMALAVVGVASQIAAHQPRGGLRAVPRAEALRYPTQADLDRELVLIEIASGGPKQSGARETVR